MNASFKYNEFDCYLVAIYDPKRVHAVSVKNLNSGNVEYRLFTIADINTDAIKSKIENLAPKYPLDSVIIDTITDIEQQIQKVQGTLSTVSEAKISIDKAKNYLEYESYDSRGIMCNVSSKSIIQLYNKFFSAGLFDLNIRKYIRNTLVDNRNTVFTFNIAGRLNKITGF